MYIQGFGVQQSDSEAEVWWSRAGSHGNQPSSVRAQSTLGMFYSRQETFNSIKVIASQVCSECIFCSLCLCACV